MQNLCPISVGMSKLNVLDITQDYIYQNPTREADWVCRQPDTGGVGFLLSKWTVASLSLIRVGQY